jgi:hypothetical protein
MPKLEDLSGRKVGRWTVIKLAKTYKPGRPLWHCVCSCGTKRLIGGNQLRSEGTKSCGCAPKKYHVKHGHNRDTGESPEYSVWRGMIQRCTNPNAHGYENYGGAGVTVCKRWLKFENFLADMGRRPKGKSLDRLKNSRGYTKSNCRWATPREQRLNQERMRHN